ncbi:hypothetical protein LTS10_011629 [Elasticomyces elasticus]|nr:hypothetical protein LTS10_011629 [Elasticomyces elasticus]
MKNSQLITGNDFKGMGYVPLSQRTTKPTNRTTESSLLSLPPELRNDIYELVLLETVPVFRFSLYMYPAVPTLLQVSQQIRNEALSMYYGKAAFELLVHQRELRSFIPWTLTLDDQARKHLLGNCAVNLRVFFDKEDKPFYDKVRAVLGDMHCERSRGWWVIAENYKHYSLPMSSMCSLERRQETLQEHTARMKKQGEKRSALAPSLAAHLEKEAERKLVCEEYSNLLRPLMGNIYDGVVKALER